MDSSSEMIPRDFYKNLCDQYYKYNYIDPECYSLYNVKRGLRNSDGTGVLAGVTQICNVHGYLINEGERMPVDGELTYRGYNIKDIVKAISAEGRFGFEEVTFLLMIGRLPNAQELEQFRKVVGSLRSLPKNFTEDNILRVPSPDIMNALSRAVLGLYAYDKNPNDISLENTLRQSIELFSRFPIIVAYALQGKRHFYSKESLVIHFPKPELSTAENILHIIRPDSKYTAEEAHLLDIMLLLHAEHGGGNNSTFTTRVLTSSGSDTYSCIAAAVGSLKGPKHGGANIKVVEMMRYIKENVRDWKDEDEIKSYLTKIIKKQAGDGSGLIYGIGHAVYTLSDPRAVILRDSALSLAEKKGLMDEFELMDLVAKLAPQIYSANKKDAKIVSANVDFYSGFVYSMLGIPVELFTALFAIARISGWCAHRIEELYTGGRIMRPAYKSISPDLEYKPLCER